MDWVIAHSFKLICFSAGIFFWAVADHFRDRVKEDTGFWSHKTGPDKNDIWHLSKRLSIAAFVVGSLGMTDLYYLLGNTYVWAASLAYIIQIIFYNGIFRLFRKS